MLKVVIAAGGTGGHIFPGLALEQELRKNRQIEKIIFLAAATPSSGWILQERKNEIIIIPACGFIGKRVYKKVLAAIFSIMGLVKSLVLIKRESPDLAFGFGSYSVFPFLLACYIRGVPFILHEQNIIPGRTIRLFSRLAREVLISFPDSEKFLPHGKTFFAGNICRESFINYRRSLGESGYEPEDKKCILVIGGSQGSHFLNKNLPGVLLNVLKNFPELSLVHISGIREKKMVEDMYGKNAAVKVLDFSDDMINLLRDCRIVITRSGATILSEISMCGVPAILIPFKESADNHQYYNALWYKERNASVLIEENDFSESFLNDILTDFLRSPLKLKKMSAEMLKLSCPDAVRLAIKRALKCLNQG